MSDGPHRSLPLRRHWKKFAERAATRSYSLEEVAAVLPGALMSDFKKEAPLNQLRDILLGDGQILLFQRDCADVLEELRANCRGSTAGNMLIDCGIAANKVGLRGDSAINAAVKNASEGYVRGVFRQIEEHYRRKKTGSELNLRERMNEAFDRISFSSVASEMLSGNAGSRAKFLVAKHTGIDEGPRI